MKMRILFIAVLFSTVAFAQDKNNFRQSLIKTELEFSDYTGEHGIREGFLKFISDEGILFRPGPVNGKEFLLTAKPGTGQLSWYPVVAEVSISGDIGYTTGPWEYRKEKDNSAIAFGNFCTVWELQKDGSWKFAIDFGSSNPKPAEEFMPLNVDPVVLSDGINFESVAIRNSDELNFLEQSFNEKMKLQGILKTYNEFCDDHSRLLRTDISPIVGKKNIVGYLTKLEGQFNFSSIGGIISSSNDLAEAYGTLVIKNSTGSENVLLNYMRVWKKRNGDWKIAVEVIGK